MVVLINLTGKFSVLSLIIVECKPITIEKSLSDIKFQLSR